MKAESCHVSDNGKLEQLQFFRFIAFLMIFMEHIPMFRFNFFQTDIGTMSGMLFFFCLSGFVSAYSLYHKGDVAPSKVNIYLYIKKKITKLYPLYFLSTIIAFCYDGFPQHFAYHDYKNVGLDLLALFKDLTLLKSLTTWRIFSNNGLTWYISCLLFLSLLAIPFNHLAFRIIKKEKPIRFFVLIIVAGIAYTSLTSTLVVSLGLDLYLFNTPMFRIGEYIIGMSIGYIVILYKEHHPYEENIWYTIIELIAFILWIMPPFIQDHKSFTFIIGYLFSLLLILPFAIGYGKVTSFLKFKPLVHLGNITFECYIFHQIIINLYCRSNGWEYDTKAGKLCGTLFCLLLTILISESLYRIKHPKVQ